MAKIVYINCDPLFNHDKSIIKYVDSERSDGKTTLLLKTAYLSGKDTGKVPVVCRRFVGEITSLYLETCLTNMKKVLPLKDKKFVFKGSPKKDGVTLYEDDTPVMLFIPLSRVTAIKSSLDWATHHNIYIDEYVPINGRYLPGEAVTILELYQTVDRKHYDNYIFVASNKLTASNPLFMFFDVIPRAGFSTHKNERFALLRWHNKGNAALAASSPFGELVAGTAYDDYNVGGILAQRAELIESSHSKNKLPFAINCNGKLYYLYEAKKEPKTATESHSTGAPVYIVDYAKYEPQSPPKIVYNVTGTNGKLGGIFIGAVPQLFKYIRSLYFSSLLLFASQVIYEELSPLVDLLD